MLEAEQIDERAKQHPTLPSGRSGSDETGDSVELLAAGCAGLTNRPIGLY